MTLKSKFKAAVNEGRWTSSSKLATNSVEALLKDKAGGANSD